VVDDGIPERVKAFLAERIDSVVQLEALLLLHASPDAAFSPDALAHELRIDPAWAEPNLRRLAAHKAPVVVEEPAGSFRYGAVTADLAATVDELAACYAARRVSVIGLIFSKPPSPLQHFADAFRIRKDKAGG